MKFFERSMDRFGTLLHSGRLSAELFVEDERFDEVMGEVTSGHMERVEGYAAFDAMFRRAAPKLWPEGLGKIVSVLDAEMKRDVLRDEDAVALATASSMAETDVPLTENPVAQVLFRVQAARWGEDARKLSQEMQRLARQVRRKLGKNATPERLMAAVEAESARLLPLANSPAGRRLLGATAKQTAVELTEEIRREAGHPLLRADEWVWIWVKVRGAVEDLSTSRESMRTLIETFNAAIDDELLDTIEDRAKRFALEGAKEKEIASWYQRAAIGLAAHPMPMLLASYLSYDFLPVTDHESEEELVQALLDEPNWSRADLEPYCRFLVAQGAAAAADRVKRAQLALPESAPEPVVDGSNSG
jgi:hypothetical protein